jgi:hypothetical protein
MAKRKLPTVWPRPSRAPLSRAERQWMAKAYARLEPENQQLVADIVASLQPISTPPASKAVQGACPNNHR